MTFKSLLKSFSEQSSQEVMHCWGKILNELMDDLEDSDEKTYNEYFKKFYISLFGPHLTWETIVDWVDNMQNEDGSTGAHWSLAETTQVAAKYKINFSKFSKEEWYATLNMIYSDFYGAVVDNLDNYVKIACKWLEDKDAPEGKLFYYYYDVVNADE